MKRGNWNRKEERTSTPRRAFDLLDVLQALNSQSPGRLGWRPNPAVGLLLPCNVTIESVGERRTIVRLTNRETLLSNVALGRSHELESVARDAGSRMARVAQTLRLAASMS